MPSIATAYRSLRARRCLCALALAAAWCSAGTAQETAAVSDEELLTYELQQLSGTVAEEIRGVEGLYTWPVGVRLDQSVVGATLQLRYTASPALLPELSHLKIRLNGEAAAVLPLPREQAGTEVQREAALDPGFFTDYNQLTVQLIGHYTTGCEDPLNSALWASVSGRSRLQLRLRRLALEPDLALLPAPFFDPRDIRRLSLPFVLGRERPLALLDAAGVMASWFGALADYRGAEFPVYIDRLPPGRHALLFATNDEVPAGLVLPPVTAPTLRVLAHPDGSAARLLVLQGRDAAQLKTAAAALASDQSAFTGAVASIERFEPLRARKPGDAPRWLPTDRPVRLGSLAGDPGTLQSAGHAPPPMILPLRLPPDLFAWNRKGVPLQLIYRYTPASEEDNSMLTVSMNDQLVRSFRLRPVRENSAMPLADDGDARSERELLIAPHQLLPVNQLKFQFAIDYHRPGPCRDSGVDLVRSSIDPDSTIDLSGLPRYARLPDLRLFANAGYPFTRHADLGQSAVVLPELETASDIETALALMGHMGRATGLAATRAVWVRADRLDSVADRDLIVIGGGLGGARLRAWDKSLPLVVDGLRHRLSTLSRLRSRLDALWGGDRAAVDNDAAPRLAADGQGPLAALVGFESPLRRGRSVVAVLASSSEHQGMVREALLDPAAVARMHGEVVVLRDSQVESYAGQAQYAVGHLPLWSRLRWNLSDHPLLLALGSLLAALLAAVWLRWALRRVARKRLDGA